MQPLVYLKSKICFLYNVSRKDETMLHYDNTVDVWITVNLIKGKARYLKL